jgi:short-subunit dehydrogenase
VIAWSLLIIVNNAGASHEMPVLFAETDPEEIDTIVQTVSQVFLQPTLPP